jgi:hypothetical protein
MERECSLLSAKEEERMKRIIASTTIILGLVAASIGSPAVAQRFGRNVSNSPRETIQYLPGGTRIHSFIREDGKYGLVIRNENKGTVDHYVIDPRTGITLPGTMPSQK